MDFLISIIHEALDATKCLVKEFFIEELREEVILNLFEMWQVRWALA